MKKFSLFFVALVASLSCSAQNPYLPLWEHVPDGEPRVFEDPDNPGSSAPTSSVRMMWLTHAIADQTYACGRHL